MRMSKEAREELEAIRSSGVTNMLDLPAVIQLAEMRGFDTLLRWFDHHDKSDYSELLLYGGD